MYHLPLGNTGVTLAAALGILALSLAVGSEYLSGLSLGMLLTLISIQVSCPLVVSGE